ncbi:MAG: hypothetical protein NW207_08285 [Cytophagales bacterium]|nr:hypothetical protein [Cytophagales bacterium]
MNVNYLKPVYIDRSLVNNMVMSAERPYCEHRDILKPLAMKQIKSALKSLRQNGTIYC